MPDRDSNIASPPPTVKPGGPSARLRLTLTVVNVYALPALVYAFAIFAVPALMDVGLDASIGGWLVVLLTALALATGVRAMRRFPTAFGWVSYGSLALTIVFQLFLQATHLIVETAGAVPTPSLDWLVQAVVSVVILWAGFSMLAFVLVTLEIVWAAAKAYSGDFG